MGHFPSGGGGSGAVSSVVAADTTVTVSPTVGAVTVSRATITGDVTIAAGSDVADVNGTANVESLIRANRLDQLAIPTSAVNLNAQRIVALADGITPTDAAIMSQLGGWVPSADTWVYASASTFTIAGVDRTAIYTKGTKISWNDGTVKYGVVASSSFSTNTTVTIMVTTDYVIANATITAPRYAYGQPPGFPTRFTYNPTPTGFSANPSTTLCWWSVEGGICTIQVWWYTAGTSNATTFTVPLPIATTGNTTALSGVEDSGTWGLGSAATASSTLTLGKGVGGGAGGFTASGSKNASTLIQYPI